MKKHIKRTTYNLATVTVSLQTHSATYRASLLVPTSPDNTARSVRDLNEHATKMVRTARRL